jgi:hypothetical protein
MYKSISTLILLALGTAAFGQDLNSTPAQLAAKYGKAVKIEKSWCGAGLSYGFQPSPSRYIYATTDPSGSRVEDLVYIKLDGGSFSEKEKSDFLLANSDRHIAWQGDNEPYWNGGIDQKTLGRERFPHTVKAQSNGPRFIIYNMHNQGWKKDPASGKWVETPADPKAGPVSFQIRTGTQFQVEQAVIKRLQKEYKEKASVTVGKIEKA